MHLVRHTHCFLSHEDMDNEVQGIPIVLSKYDEAKGSGAKGTLPESDLEL